MKTSTKYEIRRRVRTKMLPDPAWYPWEDIPKCRAGCPLFIEGKCAWNKLATTPGSLCAPCITKALEKVA